MRAYLPKIATVALFGAVVGCFAACSSWRAVFSKEVRRCREACVMEFAIGSSEAEACIPACADKQK